MILAFILIYPVVLVWVLLVLNQKCLLPMTSNYKQFQRVKQAELRVACARSEAIVSRYRLDENSYIDRVRMLESGNETK